MYRKIEKDGIKSCPSRKNRITTRSWPPPFPCTTSIASRLGKATEKLDSNWKRFHCATTALNFSHRYNGIVNWTLAAFSIWLVHRQTYIFINRVGLHSGTCEPHWQGRKERNSSRLGSNWRQRRSPASGRGIRSIKPSSVAFDKLSSSRWHQRTVKELRKEKNGKSLVKTRKTRKPPPCETRWPEPDFLSRCFIGCKTRNKKKTNRTWFRTPWRRVEKRPGPGREIQTFFLFFWRKTEPNRVRRRRLGLIRPHRGRA